MVKRAKRVANSSKAGLVMSVGRLHRLLRTGNYADRTSMNASVFLAGVLESVARTIIEATVVEADGHRITPQILNRVVKQDKDLNDLFGHAIFHSGGVIPYVHPNLIEPRRPYGRAFKEAVIVEKSRRKKSLKSSD